jgi:hypothetical protein
MNKFLVFVGCVLISQAGSQVAYADEEFHGGIESRPDGTVGTWVIGGRSVRVTERTELDEDHGPLTVGKCVEVEIENGVAEEIESEPARKCRQ